ncbi:MAG: hypothetical protein M5U22_06410 [Thermoleophilia bacterium]|nr:hypothetical protein [Thermoleophilia bacterium]
MVADGSPRASGRADFVKAEAARRGASLAEVIRALIEEAMATVSGDDLDLGGLAGLFADGCVTGADHDRVLAEAFTRHGCDVSREPTP